MKGPCPDKIKNILNIFDYGVSAANAAAGFSRPKPSENGGKTGNMKEFSSATDFFPHAETVKIAKYPI
jgi:hypothetical protein